MKAFESLHIPDFKNSRLKSTITVAVIDCGFNLNHQGIQKFIYKNSKEILGNEKDDDVNGFVDDINGWDVADEDNNVSIPESRESFFYQGTMIAGAITQIAERCFGDRASSFIKILPIKVIANQATKLNYERGFAGIEYAVKSNADIIVCGWNVGKYDQEKYTHVFEEANKKGILIIGAAGDAYSDQCDLPASIGNVFAVSALDSSFHKLKTANYNRKVDIVAAGEYVYAPHPEKNNTYGYNDGTSAAVSLVAGCAAILKVLLAEAKPQEVMRALKNTCIPLDSLNLFYAGKLGAGIPNLSNAVRYIMSDSAKDPFFNSRLPEGDLVIEKKSSIINWEIKPLGGMKGYYVSLKGVWKDNKTPIKFFSNDSLIASYTPMQFPVNTFIVGNHIRVNYEGKKSSTPCYISYEAIPVDSTRLYCSDTRNYDQPKGEFSDGSGQLNYSNNCSCKWQITAPVGKRIKIVYDEFNTQAKIDYVTLFEGNYTIPENVLGSFSGPDLPPIIVSGSNQVLIWFVTDSKVNASGWHATYEATDEAAGVKPPLKK